MFNKDLQTCPEMKFMIATSENNFVDYFYGTEKYFIEF